MRRVPLGVYAVMAGLTLGACRRSSNDVNAAADAIDRPTQVIKSFELNELKHSVRIMMLLSPEARIYDTLQVADVDQPVLLFYKGGRESSRLTAPAGRFRTDTHEVETWGGVTVVSSDSSTLTTERLRFNPKSQLITSTNTVRLEKSDSVTEGVGLETDPEFRRVKIGHEKVRFKKGMSD